MHPTRLAWRYLGAGVAGSLAGALLFGLMMSMMGTMEMVAELTGSTSLLVGWLNHLAIATLFGFMLGYLLLLLPWPRLAVGALWGFAAWVGGALVMMPFWLGMPRMVLNLSQSTPWWSLVGHLVYGTAAGVVAWALEPDPALKRLWSTAGRPACVGPEGSTRDA